MQLHDRKVASYARPAQYFEHTANTTHARCLPWTDGEWRESVHHEFLALRASLDPALRAKLGCIRAPDRLVPVETVDRHAELGARHELMTEDGGTAGGDFAG